MGDIIVTGNYDSRHFIYEFLLTPRNTGISPPMPSDDPGTPGNEDYEGAIVVTARVSNPANRNGVQEAAKRLSQAILRVRDRLASTSGLFVAVAGRPVSVDQILYDMDNTDWIVSDQQDYYNNGVGQALHSLNGRNTDIIYFEAIIGGPNSFGYSVGYPNGQGMNVLVMHEAIHLSQAGYKFFDDSVKAHKKAKENGTFSGEFYPSKFADNVEAFANDTSIAVSNLIGLDISNGQGPIRPGGYSNPQDPSGL